MTKTATVAYTNTSSRFGNEQSSSSSTRGGPVNVVNSNANARVVTGGRDREQQKQQQQQRLNNIKNNTSKDKVKYLGEGHRLGESKKDGDIIIMKRAGHLNLDTTTRSTSKTTAGGNSSTGKSPKSSRTRRSNDRDHRQVSKTTTADQAPLQNGKQAENKNNKDGGVPKAADNKQSIKDYYQQRGVSYDRARKNAVIPVYDSHNAGGGGAGGLRDKGKVSVDFFKLPQGFTAEDLPENLNLSQSQDGSVTPTSVIAEKHKREMKRLAMAKQAGAGGAGTSSCGVLDNLKKMLKNKKDVVDQRPKPSATSTNMEVEDVSCALSTSFPDEGDDSFLFQASQQVEAKLDLEAKGKVKGNPPPPTASSNKPSPIRGGDGMRKRDANGNNKSLETAAAVVAVVNANINIANHPTFKSPPVPFTSTPIVNSANSKPKGSGVVKKVDKDNNTPTSTRSSSRSKTGGGGLSRNRRTNNNNKSKSKDATTNSSSVDELFETSTDDSFWRGGMEEESDQSEETPRKVLKFDESPIRGCFDDDEDDELFSQMEIPEECGGDNQSSSNNKANKRSGNSKENEKTTLLMSSDADSFMPSDLLGEIDKLEAMAIASSASSNSIESSKDKSNSNNNPDSRKVVVVPVAETPTTRSRRRLGLSRRVRQ